MKSQSATSLWSQLTAWYTQQIPEFADTLNPGASEEEIRELEREVEEVTGVSLPSALSDVYRLNAGQEAYPSSGAFFGMAFLSPQDVLGEWQARRDLIEGDVEPDNEAIGISYPKGAVQMQEVVFGHVPFTSDWTGNYIGIDLSPAPNGKIGQITNFGGDEYDRFVFADSFEMFLEWVLKQYYEGHYQIFTTQVDRKMERSIKVSDPSYEHFLDAAPLLFNTDA